MIKYLKNYPENETQDAFAFEHGTAITVRSPHADDYPVTVDKPYALITPDELPEFRAQGWQVRGEISHSDFQGVIGFDDMVGGTK